MTDLIELQDVQPYDLVEPTVVGRVPSGGVMDETPMQERQLRLLHRPSPKPSVGTVLTGKQVKSRMWKRGTKFCYIHRGDDSLARARGLKPIPLYSIVELTRDGSFIWTNDSSNIRWISDDSELVLIYRPEEESDK